jgi:hypothetical protein
MFFPGSRYQDAATVTVTGPRGQSVRAIVIPFRSPPAIAGLHRRLQGQRLDLIASHYLADATQFWRICDAAEGIVPDSIAAQDLIAIPQQGG